MSYYFLFISNGLQASASPKKLHNFNPNDCQWNFHVLSNSICESHEMKISSVKCEIFATSIGARLKESTKRLESQLPFLILNKTRISKPYNSN